MVGGDSEAEEQRAVYQRAIDSGHPDEAPRGCVNLGRLLAKQGDVGGARVAFQRAIYSCHPDEAPRAVVELGDLLDEQGTSRGRVRPINARLTLAIPTKRRGRL